MGTLFNQDPCEKKFTVSDQDQWIESVKSLAASHKLTVAETIAALAVREQHIANQIAIVNRDTQDELMAGFGEILQAFVERE